MGKYFGWSLVAIQLGASLTYLYQADIRRCLYWLGAAFLTGVVTY